MAISISRSSVHLSLSCAELFFTAWVRAFLVHFVHGYIQLYASELQESTLWIKATLFVSNASLNTNLWSKVTDSSVVCSGAICGTMMWCNPGSASASDRRSVRTPCSFRGMWKEQEQTVNVALSFTILLADIQSAIGFLSAFSYLLCLLTALRTHSYRWTKCTDRCGRCYSF